MPSKRASSRPAASREALSAGEVWTQAVKRGVRGWLDPTEADRLYQLAAVATDPILEVGTFCGLSTAFLAAGGRQAVYAVDPCDPLLFDREQVRVAAGQDIGDLAREWWEALELDAERIVQIRLTSTEAARSGEVPMVLGGVFVDGGHDDYNVRNDLDLWRWRIAPGGWLAMHDWGVRGEQPQPWRIRQICAEVLDGPEWDFADATRSLAVWRRTSRPVAGRPPRVQKFEPKGEVAA
jgi:predicted O-methyltransferase YrrM